MAFQVTQCPSCESTFHANPKLLELAEGRVRCGACLTVFDAIEHFIESEESQSDNNEESVFVGSEPEDFFDPSVFLTRSALTQPDQEPDLLDDLPDESVTTATEPVEDEQFIELPDTTITTETSDNAEFSDFIDTEEIESSPLPDEKPERSTQRFFELLRRTPRPNESLDSFSDPSADLSTEPEEEKLETTAEQQVISDAEPDQPIEDNSKLTQEHQEFFSAIDESIDELKDEDELTKLEELAQLSFSSPSPSPAPSSSPSIEVDSEPVPESDSESSFGSDAQTQDSVSSIEEENPHRDLFSADQADDLPQETEKIVEPDTPKDYSLSVSFTLQAPFVRNRSTQDDDNATEHAQAAIDQAAAEEPAIADDDFGLAIKQAIEERDLEAAVQAGLNQISAPLESPQSEPASLAEPAANNEEELLSESQDFVDIGDLEPGPDEITPEPQEELTTEAIRARALETELEDEEALEEISPENLSALERMATPLELTSRIPSRWGQRLGLGVLFLFFSACLLGQYAWYERDTYSRDVRFRGVYEQLCNYAACTLPEFSEISAIRSDNLAVRSHPERDEALMVTVEIRNTANFEQRFPILILSFNNSRDDTIALRELAPMEYLDPGLRNIEFMPALSPVQVSVPIIDPGPDATNYTLAFRSP